VLSSFFGELFHRLQAGGVEQVRAGQQHQLSLLRRRRRRGLGSVSPRTAGSRAATRTSWWVAAGARDGLTLGAHTTAGSIEPHQTDGTLGVGTLYRLSSTSPVHHKPQHRRNYRFTAIIHDNLR